MEKCCAVSYNVMTYDTQGGINVKNSEWVWAGPDAEKKIAEWEIEEKKSIKVFCERQKKMRRYSAFAYHHRKKRIRKKYLKKLLEFSTTAIKSIELQNERIAKTEEISNSTMLIGGMWGNGTGAGHFKANYERS